MNDSHYFDWAATSPADSDILTQSLEIALEHFGNPSSTHRAGTEARRILEEARNSAAESMGVQPNQIIFTSGGTESDHIPLLSVLSGARKSGRILVSATEHPALREQCANMQKLGYDVAEIRPDKDGFISPARVVEQLTPDTLFVTVIAVNNETGCVQPIYEIADALGAACAGKRRPHFHVDCVQAAGKIPLDLSYPGIDSAALSAHKIRGPRGTGILYLSRSIQPFLKGGGQEQNIRSGTENVFGAVSFSKCLAKYFILPGKTDTEQYRRFAEQKKLTAEFLRKLKTLKNCVIVPKLREDFSDSVQERFSPWIVQAAFPGIPGNVMVRALDAKGFAISTGSACSSRKQSRPVLSAMNLDRTIQDSAVRFSFGDTTTAQAMDELFEAVQEQCAEFC